MKHRINQYRTEHNKQTYNTNKLKNAKGMMLIWQLINMATAAQVIKMASWGK